MTSLPPGGLGNIGACESRAFHCARDKRIPLHVTEGGPLIVEAEKSSAVETAHAGYGRLLHRLLTFRMTDGCKRIPFLCTGNYYGGGFA
jgi:hypothetical protein